MATIPTSGNMPFIRTDFSNEIVWNMVVARAGRPTREGFKAHLQIIDDPDFNGLGAKELHALAADTRHPAFLVADEITMTDPDRHVLCIDLKRAGRSFRIVPEEIWGVENNLSIANMDFIDFAEAVDEDGVFRGF